MVGAATTRKIRISFGKPADRERIYAIRHQVYAEELRQHSTNESARLADSLDDFNTYIVAWLDDRIVGFVSVTPPKKDLYSIDKYFSRTELPFNFNSGLYEIRILTVVPEFRHTRVAPALMYAAFRWIEEQGGTRVVAIGRLEMLDLYLRSGFRALGKQVTSGEVNFELISATQQELRAFCENNHRELAMLEREVDWDLSFPFLKPAPCFHGGGFFDAIGVDLQNLERRKKIINADVLDAWFTPPESVLDALRESLDWILRTSPPTGCEGLRDAIAKARDIDPSSILLGAGSSDLIFRTFLRTLDTSSKALILDPMYGEYAHVLERVIGCQVDRLNLARTGQYSIDPSELVRKLQAEYDLVVLVNPNSPTGRHVPRERLETILSDAPEKTTFWIDETYVDYVGADQSLETFAAVTPNVIVCKSMSKVYALSGVRVGYLCTNRSIVTEMLAVTPPWVVSLPAQIAAVKSLEENEYFQRRYKETHQLRENLAQGLVELGGIEVVPGVANFILFHLSPEMPDAEEIVEACRKDGLFLRNASLMGTDLGDRALRTAVKDQETNREIIRILRSALEHA